MKIHARGIPSLRIVLAFICLYMLCTSSKAQTTTAISATITGNPDTYYPGTQTVAQGATTITLGPAGYGDSAIAAGDLLLVIQMQGATFNSSNSSLYGDGVSGTGSGYYTTGLNAGYMEFVTAAGPVSTTGGLLTLQNALTNSYISTPAGNYGQYTFQVIRLPLYSQLTIADSIKAPAWNGSTGGVVVLEAKSLLNLNGKVITAAGAGFRGGGGRMLEGGPGLLATDYVTLSTSNANGSKGEGIAGTPRYVASGQTLLDNGVEGYPSGSYARGAPGTAGGGSTDGQPNTNVGNAGGGGGGNGGAGGQGGNAWATDSATGGKPGARFGQTSPSRLVMGGGGGAGDSNNGSGAPGLGMASSGAPGGGIVILIAGLIEGKGTIDARGGTASNAASADGSGGGGGGGSVLIYASTGQSNLTVYASGGVGGSNNDIQGPGGGGGGGVIFANGPVLSTSTVAGGIAGHTLNQNPYGAITGTAGILTQNITAGQLPPGTVLPTPITALSADFLSLTAVYENGPVAVSWTVAGEAGVTGYVVERSTDGATFEPVGNVAFKTPGAAGVNDYRFSDNPPPDFPVLYYRVEQETPAGSVGSSIAEVNINGGAGPAFSVWPNPIRSSATVTYRNRTGNTVQLRLVSMSGATVWSGTYGGVLGMQTFQVDKLPSLAGGMYILQCSDGTFPAVEKVMVL